MVGRKVFVELNSGRKYTGVIEDIDPILKLVKLLDKFNNIIYFSLTEINVLQEESR